MASEAKKKQTVVKLKEVKFRPKTEEHDYNFKVKAVREFLEEGNKARITVMFRGREITHREIGQAILTRIGIELKETYYRQAVKNLSCVEEYLVEDGDMFAGIKGEEDDSME